MVHLAELRTGGFEIFCTYIIIVGGVFFFVFCDSFSRKLLCAGELLWPHITRVVHCTRYTTKRLPCHVRAPVAFGVEARAQKRPTRRGRAGGCRKRVCFIKLGCPWLRVTVWCQAPCASCRSRLSCGWQRDTAQECFIGYSSPARQKTGDSRLHSQWLRSERYLLFPDSSETCTIGPVAVANTAKSTVSLAFVARTHCRCCSTEPTKRY